MQRERGAVKAALPAPSHGFPESQERMQHKAQRHRGQHLVGCKANRIKASTRTYKHTKPFSAATLGAK